MVVLELDVALFHLINGWAGNLVLNRIFALDETFLFSEGRSLPRQVLVFLVP